MLEDALNAAKRLDHVGAIIVEIPKFAVVTLMRPPEWILLENLVRFELGAHTPAFVVC